MNVFNEDEKIHADFTALLYAKYATNKLSDERVHQIFRESFNITDPCIHLFETENAHVRFAVHLYESMEKSHKLSDKRIRQIEREKRKKC